MDGWVQDIHSELKDKGEGYSSKCEREYLSVVTGKGAQVSGEGTVVPSCQCIDIEYLKKKMEGDGGEGGVCVYWLRGS